MLLHASDTGLKRDSMVLCENPERMSKSRIGSYITKLNHEYLSKVAEAYLLASGAIAVISPAALLELQKRAVVLNA